MSRNKGEGSSKAASAPMDGGPSRPRRARRATKKALKYADHDALSDSEVAVPSSDGVGASENSEDEYEPDDEQMDEDNAGGADENVPEGAGHSSLPVAFQEFRRTLSRPSRKKKSRPTPAAQPEPIDASPAQRRARKRRTTTEDIAEGAGYGVVPEGTFIARHHGPDAHLLDEPSAERMAKLLVDTLAKTQTAYTALRNPDESARYRSSSLPKPIESFLLPLDEGDDENDVEVTEPQPKVAFKEAVPASGDVVEFSMATKDEEHKVSLRRFEATTLSNARKDNKLGCLFNAGGHVYSLDWSPKGRVKVQADDREYLCVAAAMQPWPRTSLSTRIAPSTSPSTIQIWSIESGDWRAELEMILCFDGGRIAACRWMPILRSFSSHLSTLEGNEWLGIVAVAMQDGTIEICSVPHPDKIGDDVNAGSATETASSTVVYIRPHRLAKLDAYRGVPLCLEWHGVDRLAVGYSDGHLAVWSVDRALRIASRPSPLVYVRVSRSSISDLAWNAKGTHVYTSALDGSTYVTALAYADFSATLSHSRDVSTAVAYERRSDTAIFERLEDNVVRIVDFAKGKTSSRGLYPHHGRIRSLATSAYHPFCASGAADGIVRTANVSALISAERRFAGAGMYTIFRLDLANRSSDRSLRFIDNHLAMPIGRQAPSIVQINKTPATSSTLGWHPAICVNTVCWNANYRRENWLASGMAVGLVRIDVVGTEVADVNDNADTDPGEDHWGTGPL